MRVRVVSAIIFSIILIAGAFWSRFNQEPAKTLVVSEINTSKDTEDWLDLLNQYQNTSTTSEENLTNTDLIARQFTTDYLSLKESNQATDENLVSLIDFYVDNLPNIVSSPQYGISDIKVVSTSKTNIQKYVQSFVESYLKYETLMEERVGDVGIDITDLEKPQLSVISDLETMYKSWAEEMVRFEVPLDLSDIHLKLTNNILSSSVYLNMIREAEQDPAKAFAAAVKQLENDRNNEELISEMTSRVKRYGI